MGKSNEASLAAAHTTVYLPILLLATAMAYGLSESVRYGDSPYYAHDISQRVLLEPGHLLWRPLGAVLNWFFQYVGYTGTPLWILQGVSLAGSVACVAAMFFFIRHWCSPRTALWGAALFGFSNGFWVYGISGCPYSVSVFFMILAFIFVAPPTGGTSTQMSRRALYSGVCGGLAALFWLIQGLNLPFLLISSIRFLGRPHDVGLKRTGTIGALLLTAYSGTLGIPLVGVYLGMSLLGTDLYVEGLESIDFLSWITSASHGIRTTFGLAQILRLALGWAQSVVSVGDFAPQVRLWLFDRIDLAALSLATGFLGLSFFYVSVTVAMWLIWKRTSAGLPREHKTILVIGVSSLLANFMFSLSWEATALERYLPSAPFLVLGFSIAFDNLGIIRDQRKPHEMLAWLITIGTLISLNWTGTFAPALRTDSYKQKWLTAIHQHMSHDDLLIFLGTKKFAVVDPHNSEMPRILCLSLVGSLMSDPTEWKILVSDWIRATRNHGGRVVFGDSVLGQDSNPRDGWSFREHPVPSPKDLDDFFSPMKGEMLFSVAGERVWLAKPDEGVVRQGTPGDVWAIGG